MRLRPIWIAMAFAVCGCSFVEQWDPNGLACDTRVEDGNTNFCLEGYTCFSPTVTCIRDHGRAEGQACTDTRQCQSGQVCPIDLLGGHGVPQQDDVQTCLRACSGGYYAADACPPLYFCGGFLSAAQQSSVAVPVAACVPTSGCTPGANCDIDAAAGGTCVPISATANACLSACSIDWGSNATYTDGCDSDSYCQNVGLAMQQQFVCLSNAGRAVADGQSCSVVEAPCAKGSVCAPNGICAALCEKIANTAQVTCPTNQVCTDFPVFGQSQPSGYCAVLPGST